MTNEETTRTEVLNGLRELRLKAKGEDVQRVSDILDRIITRNEITTNQYAWLASFVRYRKFKPVKHIETITQHQSQYPTPQAIKFYADRQPVELAPSAMGHVVAVDEDDQPLVQQGYMGSRVVVHSEGNPEWADLTTIGSKITEADPQHDLIQGIAEAMVYQNELIESMKAQMDTMALMLASMIKEIN